MSKKKRKIYERPDKVTHKVRSGGSRTVESSETKSSKTKKGGDK